MLEPLTRYFQGLSPVAQAVILATIGLFFAMQAARRHEDETFTAFVLALFAIVLAWIAFAKAYSAIP